MFHLIYNVTFTDFLPTVSNHRANEFTAIEIVNIAWNTKETHFILFIVDFVLIVTINTMNHVSIEGKYTFFSKAETLTLKIREWLLCPNFRKCKRAKPQYKILEDLLHINFYCITSNSSAVKGVRFRNGVQIADLLTDLSAQWSTSHNGKKVDGIRCSGP